MTITFDSEGTTGGKNIRRDLGGNNLVLSSVLSPGRRILAPSPTFRGISFHCKSS